MMKQLKTFNWKFYISLLIMGLCSVIYTTVRTFFLGQMPDEWAYSIAGQLSWISLLYEIIDEAIILPLFFFMGEAYKNKSEFSNRIKTGMLISLGVYTVCSVLLLVFLKPLLTLMATDSNIVDASASYIRIEAVANIFGILYNFISVALITIGKEKYVYILTVGKLLLNLIFDVFLISPLPISLKLSVNGIGYANIITNVILTIIAIVLITKEGYDIINRNKLSFSWMRNFFKVGAISGLESFVRNMAYIIMVSRMVNIVGEQGTYWVANNFIWGWLLLPVTQLGTLIKQEVSKDKELINKNIKSYFTLTGVIILVWLILIPLYKPFMQNVLGFDQVNKLFELVIISLGFYAVYAVQNIFDAIFYGRGKTGYMLFESVVTNVIYYGGCFLLYKTGLWEPSLIGIAIMFGIGNVFDALVSWIAYKFFERKENN